MEPTAGHGWSRAESPGKSRELVFTARVLERKGFQRELWRCRGPPSHPARSGKGPPGRVRRTRAYMLLTVKPPAARVDSVVLTRP